MARFTADDVVDLLNDFIRIDPVAATTLCETRVPCVSAVEAHPSLIPYAESDAPDAPLSIGLIGVVGGITALMGGRLIAHYDDKGVLVKFTAKAIGNG